MDRYELRRLDYSLTEDHTDLQAAYRQFFKTPLLHRGGLGGRGVRIRQEPLGTVVRHGRNHRWRCPSASGGDGATLVDLTLVAEELGRSLAPVPWIDHVCAARLLERLGADRCRRGQRGADRRTGPAARGRGRGRG